MDENVATADFLQKDAFSSIVKETSIVPRNLATPVEENPQCKVLNTGKNA